VAVSWTYIIIAEMINRTGGIGGMIYLTEKATRSDMVYAILVLIILIGFLQDKLFYWGDKKSFKFKYA
jgi:NitT/TauT family transport system permease protein